ncbi:response regulator transcription factor [Paenibacillus ginsengihumi]|uniref:response regulator transcription factor n=1 Tax=Paenibacillus ginsengihumi TaxID=431596 RepID=UPI00037ED804|nr:response regulator [Paenibacillus ginsengihumi]
MKATFSAPRLAAEPGAGPIGPLLQQVARAAEASQSCGVILAHAREPGAAALLELQARLRLEDASLTALPSYDAASGALTVALPGCSLAFAHYLALSVKAYLHHAGLLAGRLVVASFPESADPEPAAFRELLARFCAPGEEEQDIALYYRQPAEKRPPSIVMADTNADLMDFLNVRFGMQGYEVHPAQDGLEALRLIESVKPDIVMTELTLPALDGFQLIRRIRQAPYREQCRIVVLTELGLEHEVSHCFELGAADVVRKPFSPVELDARVRRLLG